MLGTLNEKTAPTDTHAPTHRDRWKDHGKFKRYQGQDGNRMDEKITLKSPCFRWRATHPQVGPVS